MSTSPLQRAQEAVHRCQSDLEVAKAQARVIRTTLDVAKGFADLCQSERDQEIIRMKEEGNSQAAIGRKFGISRERVRQILRSYGIQTGRDKPSREAVEAAEASMLKGMSRTDAAEEIGFCVEALNRRAAELGVDLDAALKSGKAHKYDGHIWGMWTAIPGGYVYEGGNKRWSRCRCECGTERLVSLHNLTNGVSRGCGCRSTNGRERTPWLCPSTGERVENTKRLGVKLGINPMNLYRHCNQGRPYFDDQGREWVPLRDQAVPHLRRSEAS